MKAEERRPYYFPPDLLQTDLRACRLGCGRAVYLKPGEDEQFDNCLLSEPHQCREDEPELPKPKRRTRKSTTKTRRGAA